MTCEISRNAISSLASEFGVTPSEVQDGLIAVRYGLVPVPASLSARQAKALGLLTSGTSGPPSTISSASAALQASLENRLAEAVRTDGSILYKLTWKRRVTPSGSSRLALRASGKKASAGSTSASETIGLQGWKTPNCPRVNDSENTVAKIYASKKQQDLPEQVQLAGWPTPSLQNDREGSEQSAMNMTREDGSKVQQRLQDFAVVAGWPAPMAGTPAQNGNNAAGNTDSSRKTTALLSGYNTPRATDGSNGGPNQGGGALSADVSLAGWPTPTAKLAAGGEYKDKDKALARVLGPHSNDLRDFAQMAMPVRVTASGEMLTGSSAGMPSGGRLRAGHSRWLMRIPSEWASCVPTATRSTPRKRKVLSKPSLPVSPDFSDYA